MTEKEKMLRGEIYDAKDKELLAELHQCEQTCYELNRMSPSQAKERDARLRQLLGKTGERFKIIAPFFCDYGTNIEIGEDFFANTNMVILDEAKVSFGDNVFIGPNCSFFCAEHPTDVQLRNAGKEMAYPITIGNNVWLGGNVTVLAGVTIGDNCTIGAGSVVARDIPANSIAVGNLCKVIKNLSNPDLKPAKTYTYRYPHPALTADCLVFAKGENGLELLLIQRKHEPCKGCWAFPGGFMNIDETIEEAARRELKEETGLTVGELYEIGTFSAVDRDPRERVVTVAFYTFLDEPTIACANDDAQQAQWFPINKLPPLAFDHEQILERWRMLSTK